MKREKTDRPALFASLSNRGILLAQQLPTTSTCIAALFSARLFPPTYAITAVEGRSSWSHTAFGLGIDTRCRAHRSKCKSLSISPAWLCFSRDHEVRNESSNHGPCTDASEQNAKERRDWDWICVGRREAGEKAKLKHKRERGESH